MKLVYGAALGALLLAAPAVAMAGAGGGGSGGLAGVVVHPVTEPAPYASTNLPSANANPAINANSSAVAQNITAVAQALSGGAMPSFNSSALLANEKGGGGH